MSPHKRRLHPPLKSYRQRTTMANTNAHIHTRAPTPFANTFSSTHGWAPPLTVLSVYLVLEGHPLGLDATAPYLGRKVVAVRVVVRLRSSVDLARVHSIKPPFAYAGGEQTIKRCPKKKKQKRSCAWRCIGTHRRDRKRAPPSHPLINRQGGRDPFKTNETRNSSRGDRYYQGIS